MNFLQKFREFISRPTQSRTMALVGMFVLVSAVSLTVIVAQQQQTIKQQAALGSAPDAPILSNPSSITSISAELNWSSTAALSGGWFHLYYKKGSESSWTPIGNLTETKYELTGLSSDTAYQWSVRACNKDVECTDSIRTGIFTTKSSAPPTGCSESGNICTDADGTEHKGGCNADNTKRIIPHCVDGYPYCNEAEVPCSDETTCKIDSTSLAPVCDAVASAPSNTPSCDSGIQCNTTCNAPSNTCSTNNGTKLCVFTAFSGGGSCTQADAPSKKCKIDNCVRPKTCTNGKCTAAAPDAGECEISLSPSSLTLATGETRTLTASVTSGSAPGAPHVRFTSNNPARAAVNPDFIDKSPFGTTVTAGTAGSASIDVVADFEDQTQCETNINITVTSVNSVTLALTLNVQDVPDNDLTATTPVELSLHDPDANNFKKGTGTQQITKQFKKNPSSKKYTPESAISLTKETVLSKYLLIARKGKMIAKLLFTFPADLAPITAEKTLVFGDADGNGDIELWSDYAAFSSCWRKKATGTCDLSNFNGDDKVDEYDYNILLKGFRTWNAEGK